MKARRNSLVFVLLALTFFAMAVSLIPACNTVEGVGKDTQNAGKGIEDAADRHK